MGTYEKMVANAESYIGLPYRFLYGTDEKPKDAECFVMTAQGDGMKNAAIDDGDYIVFRKTDKPRNGAIVSVILESGEMMCRRYFNEGNKIRLRRENGITPDLIVDKCEILGEMVTLIKKYDQPKEAV